MTPGVWEAPLLTGVHTRLPVGGEAVSAARPPRGRGSQEEEPGPAWPLASHAHSDPLRPLLHLLTESLQTTDNSY